jgi:hypothetical protein
MSTAVFPTLRGLALPVQKSPIYSTVIKTSVSGREIRRANYSTPIWNISLSFEFLRDTFLIPELKTLMGFFMARRGSFDNFLFSDPDDNRVINELIGTGDGVTRSFQLTRTYGGITEPVCNVSNASLVVAHMEWSAYGDAPMWTGDGLMMWSTAIETSAYTVSATGLLTFTTAPAAGLPIYWSGSYYYRCRFVADQADFSKFMHQLWELKKCELRGSLGVKI